MDDEQSVATADGSSRSGGFRWWPGVLILLLGSVLFAGVWTTPLLTPGDRSVAIFVLIWLMVLLSLLWLAFFAGLRAPLFVMGAYVAVIGGFFALFRAERFSGDVVPTLTWRWTKKTHEALAASADVRVVPPPDAPADLRTTTPHDYPRFLGSDGRAYVPNGVLQTDWQAHPPKLLWKQPIGAGWSSFAVVGDFAVTQELRGKQEIISCYRVSNGERVWSFVDPLVKAPYLSLIAGDGPRATPTVYDGLVYAVGSTGVLNCLEGGTGESRWARDVFADHRAENLKWGISSSPLVYDDRVVVLCGANANKSLEAYDRLTGQPIADWDGGTASNTEAFSSPMLETLCGIRQIVIFNDDRAAGHDPTTGREIWTYRWPSGDPNVAQPTPVAADEVFIAAGYGKGCALLKLTPRQGLEPPTLDVSEVWKPTKSLKAKFSNFIVFQGHVYGFDEGVLACVDLADGKRLWRNGRYGHGQLLRVGDLILLQQEEPGDLVLIRPTPDPDDEHEMARIPALAERTWSNPVLVGRRLLIRNDREAACFEMPLEERESVEPSDDP